MLQSLVKKGIIIVIILLFLGASFTPIIGGLDDRYGNFDTEINDQTSISQLEEPALKDISKILNEEFEKENNVLIRENSISLQDDPTWQWAQQGGGLSYDMGYGVAVDTNGNAYVTGYFRGEAMFGSFTLTGEGMRHIFVAKLDTQGNWQWAQSAGGTSEDCGYGVAVDTVGNVYVTGYFQGTATFGNFTLISTGGDDVFVAKLDTMGNWLWAQSAGGEMSDEGLDVAVDTVGNVYITGFFEGTATFGNTTLTSAGWFDVFVAKLDTQGNWQWAQSAGGTSIDYALGVAVDTNGNVYITGRFYGATSFGSFTLTSMGYWDVFVAKLDAQGNWQWAEQAGGIGEDWGWSVVVDTVGNVYVTGHFQGTATFGNFTLTSHGVVDVFVAKLDTQGNWLWVQQAGGTNDDVGMGVTVDTNGNVYVTGYFRGEAMFGNFTLFSTGGTEDVFVAKLSDDSGDQSSKAFLIGLISNVVEESDSTTFDADLILSLSLSSGINFYTSGEPMIISNDYQFGYVSPSFILGYFNAAVIL